MFPTSSIVAQGWLDGWLYCSSVTVSSVGTVVSNFQVKISLNNTDNSSVFQYAKTDASDIRITGSDGTSLIPFWIENWTAGTSASIWAKVPSIPASGTTTLFIYYGNQSATSLSSGNNTFDFFDDFESWSVTPRPSAWEDKAPIDTASADATASVYQDILYTFGGYGERPDGADHVVLNTTFAYDPNTDEWTYKAPMPTTRWGMISVEYNSKIYVFGGQDRYGNGTAVNEIYDPVSDSWVSRALGNPLPIKDYRGDGVVHPDVIYFPGGKDGYEYWMMYTPYPPQDRENPCILRSHDGIRWTDNGITNPVIPKGSSGAWNDLENSDPDFIYASDINKWFMVWIGGESNHNSRKIALAYSDDGKTWTQYNGAAVNGNINPVILSGSDAFGVSWERDGFGYSKTCTPTLFYQAGTFYLYYAEEASGTNRGQIGLATFTWNNSTNSVVNLQRNAGNPVINLPQDAIFKPGGGHIDISKDAVAGTFHMYLCRELLNSANFELGLLTSSNVDGSWSSQGKVIVRGATNEWDQYHIYRSCPVVNSSGEIEFNGNNIRIYYSAFGDIDGNTGIGIADLDKTTGTVVKFTGTGPKPMPPEIGNQGLMGVLYGNKIELFYKNFHYEYDPGLDVYTRKNNVPHSRTWGTCAIVGNNIFIIGGYDYDPGESGGTANNQMLNLWNDSWEDRTRIPHARYGSIKRKSCYQWLYLCHTWME